MCEKYKRGFNAAFRGIGLVIFLSLRPASAGNLTVTNTNDSLVGSLRYAVEQALPGDTVSFDIPGTDSVIQTSSQIFINKDIVIWGRNKENNRIMTIGAAEQSRGFKIVDGKVHLSNLIVGRKCCIAYPVDQGGIFYISGKNTEVRMDSVTITGGQYLYYGGGIYDSLATVILNGCMISVNYQENTGGHFCCSYGGQGGGIYSFCGNFVISNSFITENNASDGGGIYNERGAMTICNSTISNNSVSVGGSQGGSVCGGGILNTGNLIISGSTITKNVCSGVATWTLIGASAEALGGGVSNLQGLLSIINSTICYNSCFASCGPNSCSGVAEGGGVFSGGFDHPGSAICCLINTTVFGDTARVDKGWHCSGGGLYSDSNSFGINNIFIGNAGHDGVVRAGRNNFVGEALNGDTSVAEYNWINKEIFGKDTVKLANYGGLTQTIPIYSPNAIAVGEGVRCGYFFYDTLFDTAIYKKAVTNIKPVYFDGRDWICVATKSPVPPGTQITEITVDQRGYVRPNPPCVGAFEYGQMPIAIRNGKKIIAESSPIEFIDFQGKRLTARFPKAGRYDIIIFNPIGQVIERLTINAGVGISQIVFSRTLSRGLYVVAATGDHLKVISRIFAW
jgi:hypothetical protein